MYFSEKYVLYFHSSRPRPSSSKITKKTDWLFYFSIISYGLGSLTWTNFLPDAQPKNALIPNVISIGIGVLVYVFTGSNLWDVCRGNTFVPLLYDQERLYFSNEYDRLNPATKTEGLRIYTDFVHQKRMENFETSQISLE